MEALFPGFQENMVKEEIEISHRVHSMIIGRRGMGIRKIMADYKVDIKFPRQGDANPDLVVVSCLLDLTQVFSFGTSRHVKHKPVLFCSVKLEAGNL